MPDLNEKDLPWPVRHYIEQRHRAAADGNACDHRPTYQGELDAITEGVIERHQAGVAWMASIPRELKCQCEAVYKLKHQYGGHEMVEAKLDGCWMLVPCYLTIVETVRKLAAIFAPPAYNREGANAPAAMEAVQALARTCGVTTYTNRTGPTSWAFGPEAWAKFCSALTSAAQEPVAWVRFCSDGTYEGPLMNAAIDAVRKASGAWTPLRAPAPQVPQALTLLAEARNALWFGEPALQLRALDAITAYLNATPAASTETVAPQESPA